MNRELQTSRGRFFFWIGLGILPVFWLLWMKPRDFSPRQIKGAKVWTVLFMLVAIVVWCTQPLLRDRVSDLQWTYPYIAFQVGMVLWLWLLLRFLSTVTLIEKIFIFILSIDILAVLPQVLRTYWNLLEPHPAVLLLVIIPALMHLWLRLQKPNIPNEN